jgi:site-specific DNA-methyltransferase (adenine-specific)
VDLVYLDPPFNSNNDFGQYDDRWKSMDEYVDFLIPRVMRCASLLKEDSNLLVHLDWRASHYIKVALDKELGYDNFKNEIIWQYNSGGASKRHLSRKHDVIMWWGFGDYTFNIQREPYATPNVSDRSGFHPDGRMLTDVWNIPFLSTTSKERVGYPTQKPITLLERVIEIFTNPGDVVLDGFCGSGTTGVAAKKLGRKYLLVDQNPDAVKTAEKRLANTP